MLSVGRKKKNSLNLYGNQFVNQIIRFRLGKLNSLAQNKIDSVVEL